MISSRHSKSLHNQLARSSCFLMFKHSFINLKLAISLRHRSVTHEFSFQFDTIKVNINDLDSNHLILSLYMNISNTHLRIAYISLISDILQAIALNAFLTNKLVSPFVTLTILHPHDFIASIAISATKSSLNPTKTINMFLHSPINTLVSPRSTS